MSDLTDLIPGTFKVSSVRMALDGLATVRMEDGREFKVGDPSELANLFALTFDADAIQAIGESYARYQARELSGENERTRQMVRRVMAQADRQDVQAFVRSMGTMTPLEFIAQEVVARVQDAGTGLKRWRAALHWSFQRLQELAKTAASGAATAGKWVLGLAAVGGVVWLAVRASKKKTRRRRR